MENDMFKIFQKGRKNKNMSSHGVHFVVYVYKVSSRAREACAERCNDVSNARTMK
jgi:hypothetical protein